MARRFFSGTTLEQAVLEAARNFGTEPERVAYRERERRHGFVNLRRKVVIEVDPEEPLLPEGQEVPWRPKLAGVPSGFDASKAGADASKPRTGPRTEPSADRAEKPARRAAEKRVEEEPEPQARAENGGAWFEERVAPARGRDAGDGDADRDARDRDARDRDTRDRDARDRDARDRDAHDRGPRDHDGRGRDTHDRDAHDRDAHDRDARDGGPRERAAGDGDRSGEADFPPEMDDPLDAADAALGDIADFLLYDMEWEIQQEEDESLTVELAGEDSDAIVADDGRVMRAIEHLLPRLIRSRYGKTLQARVDCNDFQMRHEQSLQAFAERMADEVRRTGRSKLLDPMSPADRRLIHVALADDATVDTESEGDGFTKRVRISPV